MNICLLSPTFLPKLGGVEMIVSSLAGQYLRAGHRVIVVTQWPRKGRGQAQDETLPYPVVRYRRPMSFFWSFGLRGIARALEQARRVLPFDVLHCHLAFPSGPVGIDFGRRHGLPVVITTHGSDIRPDSRYRERRSIWDKICRSLRDADALTAISQEMKTLIDPIVGANDKPVPIIPNAVDVAELNRPAAHDPAWPFPARTPFVLYLGGLTHKKGVNILLEAVRTLADSNRPVCRLLVAGDGADRPELEQFVRGHRLADKVQFLGKVSGPLKNYLFQNCRYVVMPSLTEGFGLVAIEAFSCGKPLVASAVGGLKELMEKDGRLGLLVPPSDPVALADAMTTLDTRLTSFSPQAIRQFARQFDWPHVAGKYLDLYQSLQKN